MNQSWLHAKTKTKYKTIVIDPPWELKTISKNLSSKFTGDTRLRKKMTYEPMNDKDIMNFDIDYFADKECWILMWTISSKIPLAINIIKKWGFKFHRVMVWHKNTGITAHGMFNNAEYVITGYRGNYYNFARPLYTIPVCFNAKQTGHSRKPNIFYTMVNNHFNNPKIDIFARKRHEGFAAYGNQVEKLESRQTKL